MPSPMPVGNSPVLAIVARAYGSMSADPLFGHAVQAPIVSAPKAIPRVNVNQVAPSPIAAAINKVKHEPKRRRMNGRVCLCCSESGAQSPRELAPPSRPAAVVKVPAPPPVSVFLAPSSALTDPFVAACEEIM